MVLRRRFLSMLMVLSLVIALCPANVLATSGSGMLEQVGFVESEPVYQFSGNVVGQGPALAEGNFVRWIDRLGNLPQWCEDFYVWLERHDAPDGVLSDPTILTPYNGRYIHQLTTVTNTVDFTYGIGQSAGDAAAAAVSADIAVNFAAAMDYAVAVYSAYDRDHPEVFWLNGNSRYSWGADYNYQTSGSAGTATYTMKVNFLLKDDSFDLRQEQYRDLEVLNQTLVQRDADVERILGDCPMDAPADEQIRYLNRVLTQTNAYNVFASADKSLDPWKCVSALAGGTGDQGPVCEGYARALKVLCDRLGIGCVLVEGDAISSANATPEAHMWNYVQAGDGWYAVDVTWNDPLLSLGDDGATSGAEREDWLLLGSESVVDEGLTFLESHPVTNVVTTGGVDFSNGPVLSPMEFVRPDNYMDMTPYRTGGYTAPVKEGYVFAGWYQDVDFTTPVAASRTTGWGYAKFVDADTLTVKFQLTAGTTETSASTDLRMLTAVDDLQYRQVNFRMTLGNVTQVVSSEKVYESVMANGVKIPGANQLFGPDARYFVTFTVLGFPQGAFDMEFQVVPCWTTMDGTVVEGTGRSVIISDVL